MIGERMMKSDAGAVPTYRRTGSQLKPQGLQAFMAFASLSSGMSLLESSSWAANVFDGFDW